MITVSFTKNPAGTYWIGWTQYENGMYWASGRTLDDLIRNMKHRLYLEKGVSRRQVYLDTKQSTRLDVPFNRMSNIFYGKFWKNSMSKQDVDKDRMLNIAAKTATEPTAPAPVEEPVASPVVEKQSVKPAPQYDYCEYEEKDGYLVVYGVKRVVITRYELGKKQDVSE